MHDAKWKASLRRRMLKWFDQHHRDLPWRKNKTPYRIWVSEIMLQQTQVATVVDYYQRFIKQFPNVKKLAAADEQRVLKLWEGLGYYRRARQLHAAAKIVADKYGGRFPTQFDQVLALPGIGRYTAGAILSISLDQQHPILEGNTYRLFARLLEMRTDPRTTENQKKLWAFAEQILPRKRCGDFNQALMELGSEICHPKRPQCLLCPIQQLCPTFVKGLQEQIPAPTKKINYQDIQEAVVVVKRGQKFLVRQCLPEERWAGLWDFPRYPINHGDGPAFLADKIKQQYGLDVDVVNTQQTFKHAVTRFRIKLDYYRADSVRGRLKQTTAATKWISLNQLRELPLSVTGRTIANTLVPT